MAAVDRGLDPPPAGPTPVVRIENHDQVYTLWRDRGLRGRTLVHLDAHHDLWWIPERGALTIANFLCRALREDHLREIFWVVPDPTWENAETRRPIREHLEILARTYPGPRAPVLSSPERISTHLLGRPLHACPLRSLPRLDAGLLLDIDVDFFLIPRVRHRGWDRHAAIPWCWPEDLAARLAQAALRPELITIAYSVEGGYTPLQWKYLGDELALRLGPPGARAALDGYERMRDAALEAQRGDSSAAERLYRQAQELLPAAAAPAWSLARLLASAGRREEAGRYYQDALARDPSYRTAYNTSGLWYDWSGLYRQAEREHRRALDLDPDDAYAHFGLGRLAARRRRWREAEAAFRRAIDGAGPLVDAHRALGNVLERQGRRAEAIEVYARSLSLVLAGHKPLAAGILTHPEAGRLDDPAHWYTHARLARLYELEGSAKAALHGYRMAIAGGCDGFLIRAHLARLYLLQRQWRLFRQQARQAASRAPADLWRLVRRALARAGL